jgi:hypothetical protein
LLGGQHGSLTAGHGAGIATGLVRAGRVARIMVYPIKSAGGVAVSRANVEPWGLRGDRRWALVDERGVRVPADRVRAIMGITAAPGPDGGLVLTAPGLPDLAVAVPAQADGKVPIDVYDLGWALAAGPAADGWVSRALDRPARLVWLDDPSRRPVAAENGGRAGDTVSLADLAPLLLATTASMRQLDAWIAEGADERGEPAPPPLDFRRFRPNLLLDTEVPFVEDGWSRVRVGDVSFRLAEHCARCKITLIDPGTLESGKEPLRTLARHRRRDGRTWFGMRVVPENRGIVSLGDPVSW